MTTAPTLPDDLAAALRHDAAAFLAAPLMLRWWVHGGEPGSPSDAITITGTDGTFDARYQRVRFDFSAVPPQKTDEVARQVSAAVVQPIAHDMLAGPLFRHALRGEMPADLADARRERWDLQHGKAALTVSFVEPFPDALAALRAQFMKCVKG
jgi:hypothetical protein